MKMILLLLLFHFAFCFLSLFFFFSLSLPPCSSYSCLLGIETRTSSILGNPRTHPQFCFYVFFFPLEEGNHYLSKCSVAQAGLSFPCPSILSKWDYTYVPLSPNELLQSPCLVWTSSCEKHPSQFLSFPLCPTLTFPGHMYKLPDVIKILAIIKIHNCLIKLDIFKYFHLMHISVTSILYYFRINRVKT